MQKYRIWKLAAVQYASHSLKEEERFFKAVDCESASVLSGLKHASPPSGVGVPVATSDHEALRTAFEKE